MTARDVSVLIPSRQEPFLRHTIEDVLSAIEADTDIIVVADGALPVEPINDHPRVRLVLLPKPIGQRAATNLAARLSNAKYIMKLDAHCRVDKGFDAKLIADCQPDWMLIPVMLNLHVFDYSCDACGYRTYQGPKPAECLRCKESRGFTQVMVWEPRWNRRTESYRFDNTLHFNYWREFMKRPEVRAQGEIHDTLSFLGACQFMEREYFWKLGGCDLGHGGEAGWGQFATEWALKVALSGGRVAVTQRTWFSHLFRTQGPGFSFSYPMSGRDQENTRKYSRDLWLNNKWPGQKYPLSALLEKFWPVPGWEEADLVRLRTAGKTFCLLPGKNLGPILQVVGSFPSLVTNLTSPMSVDRVGEKVAVSTVSSVPLVVPVTAGKQESGSSLGILSSSFPLDGADSTDASGLGIGKVSGGRQLVPSDTVGFGPIDRGDCVGPSDVLPVELQLQMGGITAGRIIADNMIGQGDVGSESSGQRADQPSVHEPMQPESFIRDANPLLDGRDTDLPVPVLVPGAHPLPTAAISDVNVRKDSSDFAKGQVRNREILQVSHDSASLQVESRSGPGMSDGLSGPHIIAQTVGIIYYSDCLLADPIMEACQRQLLRAAGGIPIVSVSLGKAIDLGDNIIIHRSRGAKSLFLQLIAGLERSTSDYIFFAEHDVLYDKSCFEFVPPRDDVYYYNVSLVRVSAATGRAITYQSKQLSGLCANRLLLLEHYYRRLAKMARTMREVQGEGRELPPKWPDGHSRFTGWEPGANSRVGHEIDSYSSDVWQSSVPYIDVRDHGSNFSRTKWKLSQFWDKATCVGWRELAPGELIPGWPTSPVGRFNEFLAELNSENP